MASRRPRRTERRTVLLVTNGQKTEKSYLTHLKRRVGNDIAITVRSVNGSPETVVKELSRDRAGISCFTEVWVVVDHDGTDRRPFLDQCRKLDKNHRRTSVHAIVSVPCFEVWLNAHYGPVRRYQDQADAGRHYQELTELPKRRCKEIPEDFPWDAMAEAAGRCYLPPGSLPEPDTQGECPSTTMPYLLRSLGLIQ